MYIATVEDLCDERAVAGRSDLGDPMSVILAWFVVDLLANKAKWSISRMKREAFVRVLCLEGLWYSE